MSILVKTQRHLFLGPSSSLPVTPISIIPNLGPQVQILSGAPFYSIVLLRHFRERGNPLRMQANAMQDAVACNEPGVTVMTLFHFVDM